MEVYKDVYTVSYFVTGYEILRDVYTVSFVTGCGSL